MNRFEDRVHTHRREAASSAEEFDEVWTETQTAMLGEVEITDGYRMWWSYIPHFIGTPGYVNAYAYGQLLARSVYRRYEKRGTSSCRSTSSCSPPAAPGRPRNWARSWDSTWPTRGSGAAVRSSRSSSSRRSRGQGHRPPLSQRPSAADRSRTCSWVWVSNGRNASATSARPSSLACCTRSR